ncbi:FERM domain-containing protein 8 isoform X5 [Periplaneta americana]|uniref:FERM domain-containing protein 8 isoform X5 n=1 Tax=Periplaneta americana TaxID=6978 RepID=UPI0037E98497
MLENDPHTIHLVTMSATEGMDNHQADNSQNYITVIPVEYPRSRVYPQPPEYLVDQYSDYLRDRTREEYIRGDYNINSEPQFDEVGPLYTVSQRFERDKPHLGASSVGYGTIGHDVDRDRDRDWDRSLHSHTSGSSDTTQQSKESSSAELQSDEQQSSQLVAAKPLKMCIYLMSRVVLHMDLEDGVNITVQELVQSVLQEEELGLPRVAASIFTLWMCSGLLELQLKPHHKPYEICRKWRTLVSQYSTASESRIERDEPVLSFQRNVFFSKRDEEKIKDQKLLDLLYEEARYNILEGRYPCEVSHYIMLGGIQARIELGPYNPQVHTTQFFRGAFFQGQVEQPVRGLTSLITHQDVPVLVAINAQGVYVIDDIQCTLLLGLKYEELSWDFAKPSQEDNPDCLPCLFLQFMVLENGTRVSKILQVFSKQAVMMDALISGFVEELKQKTAAYTDETDRPVYDTSTDSDALSSHADTQVPLTMVNRRELPQSCLSNKLSKLTLATFDEDGRCIGQMGSWSFSY